MEHLTYEAYRTNPQVREQLERDVRRFRAEAVHQYIVAPLMQTFARMFTRAKSRPAPTLQMSV